MLCELLSERWNDLHVTDGDSDDDINMDVNEESHPGFVMVDMSSLLSSANGADKSELLQIVKCIFELDVKPTKQCYYKLYASKRNIVVQYHFTPLEQATVLMKVVCYEGSYLIL